MENMTQELNIDNYDLLKIKKIYNSSCNTNHFLNSFTLMDVEEGKKKLYLELIKKYNSKNLSYIEKFVNETANKLMTDLFSNVEKDNKNKNTQMVGIKNIIKDQRQLNETYFNETYRIMNIDSTYRDNLYLSNNLYNSITSSDMFVKLNDELDDVVQLELTNLCIPFTFYNIDTVYNNNYFYIQNASTLDISKIEIESGNYTNSTLVNAISDKLFEIIPDISLSINTINNKTTFTNNSGTDNYIIIFYDHLDENTSFKDNYLTNPSPNNQCKLNNNLGWILGFRNIDISNLSIEYNLNTNASIVSESLCYISHTKYFTIIVDDLNKNQTNKSLVQIGNTSHFIRPTQYFKEIDNSLNCLTNSNFNNYCENRVDMNGNKLTKNQIYSSLQINNHKNKLKEINSKLDSNLINNVFAIIPFENKSLNWGESMIISDKNRYKRKYSGPVNISKLNIKLLDDKGNIMNLNGGEWSFTVISTHLYQY